jgi:signal transduction histidine kinase
MKRFPFPLSYTVPAILLMAGMLSGLFSYQQQSKLAIDRARQNILQQARFTGSQTATMLEFLYRRTDIPNAQIEGATLLVSGIGSESDLKLGVLSDEHNRIQIASNYDLRQQSLDQTSLVSVLPTVKAAQQSRAGQVVWQHEEKTLQVVYPVLLPAKPGELTSSRIGTLILEYDLSRQEQQANRDAIERSLKMTGFWALLCVLIWLLFDRIVTKRATTLVTVSDRLAQGDLTARAQLQGSDELAQISQAFNRMAHQIQQDTAALQYSEGQLRQQAQQLEDAVAELQNTQIQLIQTEKMSSLGQLVAGVAHEINNPVNFIHGNLGHIEAYTRDLLEIIELYQQEYPIPTDSIQQAMELADLDFLADDLPKILSSIRVGTERIREIVLTLRNFSRLDEAEMKPVNIHEGIDSTLLILQNRFKAKPERPEIQIIQDYSQLPLVECYAGQLNQVFMNLISNAIDALEDNFMRGNWLQTIAATNCPLPQIRIHTEYCDGDRIRVCIADNGPGIPEVVRKRLFDPFFTTKPVGEGTGLGLSISYQIITEKHHGKIWCESQPGEGASFWIEIPVSTVKKNWANLSKVS